MASTSAEPIPDAPSTIIDVGGDRGVRRAIALGITKGVIRPLFLTPFALPRVAARAISRVPIGPGTTVRRHGLGGVEALEVVVGAPARPPLLFLHGGGYCVGSPETDKRLAARLSRASGRPVWLPRYRLAPEHRHPAALDDAVTAARALHELYALPIAIGGDSAGGGLALATTMKLRDRGDVPISHVVLLSPWLDLTMSGGPAPGRSDPMMSDTWLARNAGHYAGEDLAHPEVSPLFGDLSGLPPVHIEVGTDEHLFADAERAHQAIEAAGGAATLVRVQGYWHVFQIFAGLLPAADDSIERIGTMLRT